MDEYILNSTSKTPHIVLKEGSLLFEGKSIPEDPTLIYKPVLQWVNDYLKTPPPRTTVDFRIEYCDTGSTKSIFEILKTLSNYVVTHHGGNMVFNWHFEKGDGEILELGEFLQSKLKIIFNFIES